MPIKKIITHIRAVMLRAAKEPCFMVIHTNVNTQMLILQKTIFKRHQTLKTKQSLKLMPKVRLWRMPQSLKVHLTHSVDKCNMEYSHAHQISVSALAPLFQQEADKKLKNQVQSCLWRRKGFPDFSSWYLIYDHHKTVYKPLDIKQQRLKITPWNSLLSA